MASLGTYVGDPGVWLAIALGLGFATVGGVLGGWLIRYTSTPEYKAHYVRVQALKLAFACTIIGGMFFCIRYLQWHFGGRGDPYTGAYVVGLVLGLPAGWFFEFRP